VNGINHEQLTYRYQGRDFRFTDVCITYYLYYILPVPFYITFRKSGSQR
jgi:hypothetical protein